MKAAIQIIWFLNPYFKLFLLTKQTIKSLILGLNFFLMDHFPRYSYTLKVYCTTFKGEYKKCPYTHPNQHVCFNTELNM